MSEKERLVKDLDASLSECNLGFHANGDYYCLEEKKVKDFILSDRRKMLDEIEEILGMSCWIGRLTKEDVVRLAKNKIDELRKG